MVETTLFDIATRPVLIADASETADKAARLMRDNNVGCLLVTGADGLGIVTDRDLVVRGVAAGRTPEVTTIGEIATRPITTLCCEASLEQALELMGRLRIRRLPLVDHIYRKEVVAIVSLGDLATCAISSHAVASAIAHLGQLDPHR
jgi:CBS domain-containing protein